MNKFYRMFLGVCLLAVSLQGSAAEVSGKILLATDYVFRGISQTSENPSVQANFHLTGAKGFYAGIAAANVNYDGSIELGFYAGYANSITEALDFDISVAHYNYPDDAAGGGWESTYDELYGSLSFKGLTLGFAWSPDFTLESGTATYLYATYAYALPKDFMLSFHYGYQSVDKPERYGTPDRADYSIGVTKSFKEVDLSLAWHDTDISSAECYDPPDDTCSSRVVLALSKSF